MVWSYKTAMWLQTEEWGVGFNVFGKGFLLVTLSEKSVVRS